MIETILQQTIAQTLHALYAIEVKADDITLQNTRKDFQGDFTLVVFPYVKQARKSPEATANEIGQAVQQQLAAVAQYNVVKGFLNFVIADSYWLRFAYEALGTASFGFKQAATDKAPIVVEYSSPNTNKPLHLGHVRNNLLGWAVSQLLKANGNNVKMVNLVNDRGIHICKSMLAWQLYGQGETPESSGMKGDHLVGKYYVAFDQHYKEQVKQLMNEGMTEEEAKKKAPLLLQAQDMLRRWEEGDTEVRQLWQQMNEWVYAGFDETYARMGIHFDKIYYESNTYMLGKELVQKGLDSGAFYRRADGAVCADLTPEGLDQKVLLRSDGTSVYMTQDLGSALLRQHDFNADQLIYVVGNEQDYHFKVLKIILKRLGFDWADSLYHLSYGMVELPSGKMKSREGTVVDADDLISEMEHTAEAMSREHGKNVDLSPEEQQQLYHMLAMGALKYFILKVDPTKNMLFNPAESIDFNGNTGPFIQYTHARICSIIKKAENDHAIKIYNGIGEEPDTNNISLTDKEREVVKQIHNLPSTITQAASAYSPAMIANYAFDLAKAFNSFYQDTPILREPNTSLMGWRVQLCALTARTLRDTMNILGIEMPQRM